MSPIAQAAQIREATAADAEAIARLHAESWQSAYRGILSDDYLENHALRERMAAWRECFSKNCERPKFVLIAELDDEMVGFVCVLTEEDPVYGSLLDNLHVAPRLTGQGIGKKLLSAAAKRAPHHEADALCLARCGRADFHHPPLGRRNVLGITIDEE